MYSSGYYRSPLDDPRGMRKRNKLLKEIGKRAPLISLLLLVALFSSVGLYSSRVSRLQAELQAQKKEADANRDLSAVRFRHAESLRQEMESMRGRLRTAEDDVARKGALISHNNHQIEDFNRKVADLQGKAWEEAKCRNELEITRNRASNAERSLQEKEAVIVERDHHVADLQRQLSDALARQHSAGVPAAMPPPQVNLERPGWTDPKGGAAATQQQGTPAQPSRLPNEAHAGFAHVANMLSDQGIRDPLGDQHLASILVKFFEERVADMIGAEFHDPHAAQRPPLPEQLASHLTAQGVMSIHGPEHFQSTVRHMVDAIGHLTGGAVNPDAAAGMVGRAELAQEGTHPVDTHAGHPTGGRKDLGGVVDAVGHAAHPEQQHHTTHPGYDHGGYPGWQHHDSHHRAPEDMAQHQDIHQNTPEQPPEALDPHAGMHPHIVAAQEAYQKDIKRAKPDAAGFIY